MAHHHCQVLNCMYNIYCVYPTIAWAMGRVVISIVHHHHLIFSAPLKGRYSGVQIIILLQVRLHAQMQSEFKLGTGEACRLFFHRMPITSTPSLVPRPRESLGTRLHNLHTQCIIEYTKTVQITAKYSKSHNAKYSKSHNAKYSKIISTVKVERLW